MRQESALPPCPPVAQVDSKGTPPSPSETPVPTVCKVLLVNSQALRRRTLSDPMLENSLVLLKTCLQKHNVPALLWDRNLAEQYCDTAQVTLSTRIRRAYAAFFVLRRLKLHPIANWCLLHINRLQGKLDELLQARAARYIEEICRLVQREQVRVVGVKCWYGDAFRWSAQLAKELHKRFPQVLTIAGGPQVNVHHDGLFSFSDFDVLVYPEGDQALPALVAEYAAAPNRQAFFERLTQHPIPNSVVRGGTHAVSLLPLDEKTVPMYGEDARNKVLIHSLQEARGCDWGRCSFCSHPEIFPKFQVRPTEHVLNEIESCLREGIGIFRFTASDTPMPVALNIAKALLARRWRVQYAMFFRAGQGARKRYDKLVANFALLASSGLRAVFVGGETGHDRINTEVMKKGITADDLVCTIMAMKQAARNTGRPIDIALALIYPTPLREGTTLNEVYGANLDLVARARPNSVIVCPPAVFPRTEWWKYPERYGFRYGSDYLRELAFFEYALYKPAELWPVANYGLGDLDMKGVLQETSRLRTAITAMGIETELNDEYLLMARAAGYEGAKGLHDFKQGSLLDILSGDGRFSNRIYRRVNLRSRALANESVRHTRDIGTQDVAA